MSGIQQWQCGACGGLHGWTCPYFGGPGRFNPPPCSEAEGERRRAADKKAMRGAFSYLRDKSTDQGPGESQQQGGGE